MQLCSWSLCTFVGFLLTGWFTLAWTMFGVALWFGSWGALCLTVINDERAYLEWVATRRKR